MDSIMKRYTELCNEYSDIYEHLPTLKRYAEECETVVEMGVRWIVSTWAFLAGNPKKMISYDTASPSNWGANIEDVYEAVKGTSIDFQFILQDVLTVELEPVDLLFLDTRHTYNQLKQELNLHHTKVNKYIIIHDTTSFEFVGESKEKGLWPAIEEFLLENPQWQIHERYTNNNGITILRRVNGTNDI